MDRLLYFLNNVFPLSADLVQHLQKILRHRAIAKRDYILKAGHICRDICFVESGLLRCYYLKDDAEVCSWFMKEGDVIISVESFFSQRESYENIQAIEDCELWCIEYNQLQYIYRHFPEFNFIGRVLTERYYVQSEQRLYAMRMMRAQERYDYLLAHHPEIILRVPTQDIASYLGIRRETLTRLKKKTA